MAEYREIFGEAVQSLSSDTGTIEGQIWYDSSNNNLKLYSFGASNSFSSAPNLNTARGDVRGGGTGTAAFFAGGGTPTPNVDLATENWDGSTWTTSGNMNNPGFSGGGAFGTQTAGVAAYGSPGGGGTSGRNNTEEYNGSTWTAVNNVINPTRQSTVGLGPQTAGIVFGGFLGPAQPDSSTDSTVEYDGTCWTAGGALGTARQGISGAGGTSAQTACLAIMGMTELAPGPQTNRNSVEEYNGSSWTAKNSLNTARGYGASLGTTSRAVAVGGNVSPNSQTEIWDGTCWSTNPTSAPRACRNFAVSGNFPGTYTDGGIFGGGPPGAGNGTFEWSFDAAQQKTITTT
jgi:hypothetical protein